MKTEKVKFISGKEKYVRAKMNELGPYAAGYISRIECW